MRLTPKEGCSESIAIKCLADYAFAEMGPTDIQRLISEGLNKCFPSDELNDWRADCLPVRMGTDTRNNQEIEVRLVQEHPPLDSEPLVAYSISGSKVWSKEVCCSVGGRPWNKRGSICVPPETSLAHGVAGIPSCEPTPSEIAQKCLKSAVPTVSVLSPDDLQARAKRARACFAAPGSPELLEQIGVLPFAIALHERTQWAIQLDFRCSGDCPAEGDVGVFFPRLTQQECCAAGEAFKYDGGYLGCIPRELATEEDLRKSTCRQVKSSNSK
jgi:hypothetical protein